MDTPPKSKRPAPIEFHHSPLLDWEEADCGSPNSPLLNDNSIPLSVENLKAQTRSHVISETRNLLNRIEAQLVDLQNMEEWLTQAPLEKTLLQSPPFPPLPPSTYEMLSRGNDRVLSAEVYASIYPGKKESQTGPQALSILKMDRRSIRASRVVGPQRPQAPPPSGATQKSMVTLLPIAQLFRSEESSRNSAEAGSEQQIPKLPTRESIQFVLTQDTDSSSSYSASEEEEAKLPPLVPKHPPAPSPEQIERLPPAGLPKRPTLQIPERATLNEVFDTNGVKQGGDSKAPLQERPKKMAPTRQQTAIMTEKARHEKMNPYLDGSDSTDMIRKADLGSPRDIDPSPYSTLVKSPSVESDCDSESPFARKSPSKSQSSSRKIGGGLKKLGRELTRGGKDSKDESDAPRVTVSGIPMPLDIMKNFEESRASQPLPNRDVVAAPTPPIKRGHLSVDGATRYIVLSRFKLQVFRSQESNTPMGTISLGFKAVEKLGTCGIAIVNAMAPSSSKVNSKYVQLIVDTPEQTDEWITEIVAVIDEFKVSLFQDQKIGAMNSWSAYKLTIFVGSWNVGNAVPGDINSWISLSDRSYDLVAIGSQECRYPLPGFAQDVSNSCAVDWFNRVKEAVGKGYVVAASESLWEIRNIVFIKQELAGFVRKIGTQTVATGIANALGNKGGVGIKFNLFDTSFCFVSAHLAAHMEEVSARNFDYHEILTHMKFDRNDIEINNLHNFVFFYGDLNYRIAETRERVVELIKENQLKVLRSKDQLSTELRAGRVFAGFKETSPSFRPTYRYERNALDETTGQRVYDDAKARVPSWCDRILWKHHPGFWIKQINYNCCDEVLTSDHSPVFATFCAGVRLPPTAMSALNFTPPIKRDAPPILTFSNIKCYLDFGRDVNVYIKIVASFCANKMKTPFVRKTDAPTWEKVDPIPLTVWEKEYINSQQVFFIFLEERIGREFPLGQSVIPLRGSLDQSVWFSEPIYFQGKMKGMARGMVNVVGCVSSTEEIK